MTEDKIRQAAALATELAVKAPDFAYARLWELVFTAMTYEPYFGAMTASAAREAQQQEES